ncbi:MAG TPA: glucoamylase family protein [Steroidobacteraceae bacterium]|nr:glucoamylase family protein [Steroidobacteraceae bacterium]
MTLRGWLSLIAGYAALVCGVATVAAAPVASAPAASPAATTPAAAPSGTTPGPIRLAEASGALREPQAVLFDPFLSELEERTFRYFWETANPKNGLIPDRYPTPSFASIAAVGFGLTAYPIGVERQYVSRTEARERVLATLRFFQHAPNQHGFFYHFLEMKNGARANDSEVSTVDTALLLAGMLFCQSYFDSQHPHEVQIRKLVDEIYRRVDWTWAQPRPPVVALAWTPESGFSGIDWQGYNEAMLVYLLALGSPTHPISPQSWDMWTSTYDKHWGTLYDQTYLSFGPLFGHQYTHVWVDFRGIRDAYMRAHGLDYFENSRRATYTQRRYAIANPKHWQAYGKNIWGISASDGPGGSERYEGQEASFMRYAARGVGADRIVDDGTIAPTAAISSLPFAPEIVLPATLEMYHRYGSSIYSVYGFLDAFNASFRATPDAAGQTHSHVPDSTVQGAAKASVGWVDQDYVGIDEGPILAMIENYRSDFVWRVMRNDPYLRQGLERAGFSGGWLAPGQ